jgi:gliding motility-associatede transport system auxiliary component
MMLRRVAEGAFWVGLLCLAAAVVLSLGTRFDWSFIGGQWMRLWWPLVVVGLGLVLLSFLPQWRDPRATLSARSLRYGLNSLVAVVLVIGVIGVVEALSYRHNARVDLTENRRHSLSPQTIEVLKNLKAKVSAVSFYRADQPGKRLAEDLFKQYARYAGDKFTWKSVDPDREPTLARAFGVETYGTTVLESGGRTEKVQDGDQEEKLTNSLIKVTRAGKPIVYVIQGHGELEIGSSESSGLGSAKSGLEAVNYEVKPITLARTGKIPDDAAVVVIAGPRSDFFAPEIDALDAYIGRGGKLLVMLDPVVQAGQQEPEALKRLLAKYGIEVGTNVVIEMNPLKQMATGAADLVIVDTFEPHPITRDLRIVTLFPSTRTVGIAAKLPTGVAGQRLGMTSRDSFAETDLAALRRGEARPDASDPRGPLPVAVVATKDKARVVAYGTSQLAANRYYAQPGNRDFFLNSVSWLAEQEDQISIRPRDTKQTPVFLTSQQDRAVFWLPVIVLPAVAVVGGILAVVRRRAAN